MARNINDFLASGEVKNLNVGQTLTMEQANDPAADGLFMRVNEHGQVVGYRAVNQDLEWTSFVDIDVIIGSTETHIISLVIDHDITADNGSYAFSCKLKNGASQRDDNITFLVKDQGGSAIATKHIALDKGEDAFPATFYGDILNDYPAGSEFKIYAFSSNNSIARGSLTRIGLKIIEAQAAPVANEMFIKIDGNLGNSINRTEIEDALVFANEARPKHLKHYYIEDNFDNIWLCIYIENVDKFAVKKLNLK
jgi:hypothetical protein